MFFRLTTAVRRQAPFRANFRSFIEPIGRAAIHQSKNNITLLINIYETQRIFINKTNSSKLKDISDKIDSIGNKFIEIF